MPLDLREPFAWTNATGDFERLLDGLQPNILKGHTREFLTILFLSFGSPQAGRSFCAGLVGSPSLMKSANQHLKEIAAFNAGRRANLEDPPGGTPYVGLGLTKAGYDSLGVPEAKQPKDPSFRGGMQNADLSDPEVEKWEAGYRDPIHAIVLVGDSKYAPRNAALNKVKALIASSGGVRILFKETGHSQHNGNGDGIEHFGYVDGRSQPLFFTEDVDHEQIECDGTANWNPGFGPDRAVVPDLAAPDPTTQFGSYFIFRKLEQNVKRFKQEEEKFASKIGLRGDDRERAGAMIVGRFEDGTPLTMQKAEGTNHPVPNNFNYDSDGEGGKCPFFGHIRKMNPRGSGGFGQSQEQERKHIMPRRGQTYGTRTDDLNDGRIFNKPKTGVGLLFMAFNANIAEQFEFVQKSWSNFGGFPQAPNPPGVDLVIGQVAAGSDRPLVPTIKKWGGRQNAVVDDSKPTVAPKQAVTMKGGEYFFMPSLAFLGSLV